jgi:hypothetical protein
MTRERYVHQTREVPHLWAHQAKAKASNPQHNLYFEGPTIYSYRGSWPLARIYTRKSGTLVLTNSGRYSVTTSQHQSAVNRAASHMVRVAVPEPDAPGSEYRYHVKSAHECNVAHLVAKQARLLKEAQRVLSESSARWRHREALGTYDEQCRYQAFFGIRRKIAPFPDAAWDAAIDRARRIETPDPVRDAKRVRSAQLPEEC